MLPRCRIPRFIATPTTSVVLMVALLVDIANLGQGGGSVCGWWFKHNVYGLLHSWSGMLQPTNKALVSKDGDGLHLELLDDSSPGWQAQSQLLRALAPDSAFIGMTR